MSHISQHILTKVSAIVFSVFIALGMTNAAKVNTPAAPSQQKYSTLLAQSLSKSSRYHLLSGTTSPNKRFAIAWGIPGRTSNSPEIQETDNLDKVENYLVDIKTNKIITTLRNSQYFPNQNHGSIITQWSPDSQLVLFAHERKWEPQAVSLAKVNGVQVNVLSRFVQDTRSYLAKRDGATYQANQKRIVLNIDNDTKSLQLTSSRLQIPVMVYIPKAENGYERNLLVTYQVAKQGNNIIIRLLGVKNR